MLNHSCTSRSAEKAHRICARRCSSGVHYKQIWESYGCYGRDQLKQSVCRNKRRKTQSLHRQGRNRSEEIKSKVRVLACQDQSTPRQIYANVMENASQAAAARLDFNDISQIVYYHRQDEDPKLPCNPAIMIIPNELMMYKNEIFVLHDTGPSTRRMIVFSTPKELLEESEYWGLDGTFDLVPKGFKQLLSIHAKVGETFVPCIHGLLPKKSSGTYNRFFAVLKQSVPHSQVRHSHVDYERSLMNSFNNAFPVVDLHGCFFHFAQCLSRKVQKFGLIRHYKEGVNCAASQDAELQNAEIDSYYCDNFRSILSDRFSILATMEQLRLQAFPFKVANADSVLVSQQPKMPENLRDGIETPPAKKTTIKSGGIMKFGYPGFDNLRTYEDFVLSYDRRTRTAHWVVEHLTPDRLVYDPSSQNSDYLRSGYDRGHLAAAGNHRKSQNSIDQTFFLTNMSPQVGRGFNRDKWNDVEIHVRRLAKKNRNVYICTGPLYLPQKESDGNFYVRYRVIGENRVAALVETEPDKYSMEAYLLPNQAIPNDTPISDFLVSLDSIERSAGFLIFDLFTKDKLKMMMVRNWRRHEPSRIVAQFPMFVKCCMVC
uniref:Endonuclease n=1 Tax=Ditylenchus dipsaci TaxID=166011 RepID=A0A915EAN9_9BILA